jgi:hypothetical protein
MVNGVYISLLQQYGFVIGGDQKRTKGMMP